MDAVVDRRIYFLGLGAVGKLIAHSFADIPDPPPMTLLFHKKASQADFEAQGRGLRLIRNGISDTHHGFDSEPAFRSDASETSSGPIYNLIVGTKAPLTAAALLHIKYRLLPESTIVFLQNGMGMIEDVNEKVFPDLESRPYYVRGIVSHAAINKSVTTVEHTGIGNITLSGLAKNPLESDDPLKSPVTFLPPSTRYLLRTLTRTPLLGALALQPKELMMVELEKLANNCVINPLTAILDCKNGELLHSRTLRLGRLLLAEISLVIRAMPELATIPGIDRRFSPASLEKNLKNLIFATAQNRSSMLQDISKGRWTEIDFLNGYIFRRGEELGIRCMVNYTVMTLIRAKSLMERDKQNTSIPIAADDDQEPHAVDDDILQNTRHQP